MTGMKPAAAAKVATQSFQLYSVYLERMVTADVYYSLHLAPEQEYSLLLFNDGQDLLTMGFLSLLDQLYQSGKLLPLFIVGIHCGEHRLQEYGTACMPDFAGRGSRAGRYSKFVVEELLPYLRTHFRQPSFRDKSFAGFSLGALSALDIVWNHADEFARVGVFSGSLWWRRRDCGDGYNEAQDRIMHLQVRKGSFYPWLRFFFQCGTQDETADRNNNGIIDSIDDTLDLVAQLTHKGYPPAQIHYLEVQDGRHEPATWAQVMPDFLKWGWSK